MTDDKLENARRANNGRRERSLLKELAEAKAEIERLKKKGGE